jgi:hypothetical protein
MDKSLNIPTFYGLSIPTHRSLLVHDNNGVSSSPDTYFPYEPIIAAIAIAFFRFTVRLHVQQPSSTRRMMEEPLIIRCIFAGILGVMAYTQQSYQHIVTMELSSYMISYFILYVVFKATSTRDDEDGKRGPPTLSTIVLLLQKFGVTVMGTLMSLGLSYGIVISFCDPVVQHYFMTYMVPQVVKRAFLYLFPILELQKAYTIMEQFMMMDQAFFHHMIQHLFFVTFHIQVGMGYLGIAFLRSEQSRRNQLIRLDVYDDDNEEPIRENAVPGKNGVIANGNGSLTMQEQANTRKRKSKENQMLEKSRIFQRGAAPFSTYCIEIFRLSVNFQHTIGFFLCCY